MNIRTHRKWLIVTGLPLSLACMFVAFSFGGIYALLGIMGMGIFNRAIDLLDEKD